MCEKESSVNTTNDHIHRSFEGNDRDTEIVIGLVGAVGTQLKRVVEAIKDRLKAFNYDTREIRVSQDVIGILYRDIPSQFSSEFDRITTYIDRGNEARKSSGDSSILALGICSEMCREREHDEQRNFKPRSGGSPT